MATFVSCHCGAHFLTENVHDRECPKCVGTLEDIKASHHLTKTCLVCDTLIPAGSTYCPKHSYEAKKKRNRDEAREKRAKRLRELI